VVDDETARFLEGGCSLIVGAVGPDGAPYATRAWGLDILDGPGFRVRLLLPAGDVLAAEGTGARAVTAADVRTFRSVQLKGHACGIEATTDEHRRRAARFCDAFFAEITATDGTSRALLDRFVPADFAVCHLDIEHIYDQTPGPRAGAPVEPVRR
jgi:hypothetical protein